MSPFSITPHTPLRGSVAATPRRTAPSSDEAQPETARLEAGQSETPRPEAVRSDSQPLETTPDASDGPLSFADLGLRPDVVALLAENGYTTPTPIQERAIPLLLEGRDVIGRAQTGTGKTAAFSLPMVEALDVERLEVQGLVMCPTRELALQVTDALRGYGRARNVRVTTVYGGAPISKQVSELRRGVHVVVGTPGRLKDCIERGILSLASVRHVVLDEADEMLRMGFIEDVEVILSRVPQPRQTALFSATMPPDIQRVARTALRDPVEVKIEDRTRTVERTEQRVLVTHADQKVDVLARLIESEPTDAVLVFARTRASCGRLVDLLRTKGVAGAALHGDLSQDQREAIVQQLRARKIQIVVATDIAARGLDVDGITHVINYDPPSEPDVYVHRIGRTGRAGREGVSILLITPRERRLQKLIERFTGQRMTPMEIPTNEELLAGRMARFRDRVRATIADGELDPYERMVDELAALPDGDLRSVAAALARLASGSRPLEITAPEPVAPSTDRTDRPARRDDTARPGQGGPPSRGRAAGPRPTTGPREVEEGEFRLFVSLGKTAGIRPGDLVGAIANQAGVPGSAVGAISIHDKVSFVDVAAEYADTILETMKKVTVRGRTATFIEARPFSESANQPRENARPRDRAPYGDHDRDRGDRGPARGPAGRPGGTYGAGRPTGSTPRGPKGRSTGAPPPWKKRSGPRP